jgi:hypothetical protein
MMNIRTRFTTLGLAAVMGIGSLTVFTAPAEARRRRANSSEKAWKAGTYLGAAGTAAAFLTGKGTLGLIGLGATALSYSQWKKEVRKRHDRNTSYAAYRRYRGAHSRYWARRRHR